MAYAVTTNPGNSFRSLVTAPFRFLWHALNMLSECGPKMEEVRRLNATSDEDLAARGLTRAGEVQRIFRDRFYI